ncbi:DNA replication/repair protein RecF [bacterium]|nr:DNA replication/repair protein RecF [bacterium]
MILQLRLQSFRAYDEAELELDPEFNRIIGQNGIGKTTLLEALAHLSVGGSPWSDRATDVISKGKSYSIIAGKGPKRRQEVSIKLKRGGRKEVLLCGKAIPRMSELLGVFPTTAIGPKEIDLIKGSPSIRRRLLDSILCQLSAGYTLALSKYRKLVAERNSALKGVRSGKIAGGHLLIETLDESIAPEAAVIMEGRLHFIEEVSKLTKEIYFEIMGGEGGEVSVEYSPTIKVLNESVGDISKVFLEKLSARRKIDLDTGETAIGPHRDDMLFLKDGEALARFGSWGQARAASISTILGASDILHRTSNEVVTLLLDDCFAELDPDNTGRFVNVAARFGQVIIASPREIDSPNAKNGALFVFDDIGHVRREN